MNKSKLEAGFEKVFAVFLAIQLTCLIFITVLMFGQVIVREVFNTGVQWVYEMSCMLQVTMVWLGVPALLYKSENITITILYNVTPKLIKRILDVLKYIVIVSSVVMMTYGYVLYIKELALTKSPALRIPNYLFFWAFPFGIFMIILVLIFKTKMILGIENPPGTPDHESSMGAV